MAENTLTNWTTARLAEVVSEIESGKRPKGGVRGITEGIPSLGGEHLSWDGGFNFENVRFVPKDFADQMPKGHIQHGDILVVKDGATTSKTAFVGKSFPYDEAVINEHVFRLKVSEHIHDKYVFSYLWSKDGKNAILADFRGAAQGGISANFVFKVEFPLPPLNEQRRIVAKIEELFSELDAGVESLKTARLQLGVYRQALLKKAFEGKLTEKWRAANPDKLEPADALLARIRQEREARYQQQLTDWKTAVSEWEKSGSKGKRPSKPRKPKPVEPLTPKELTELPDLPLGWMWAKLGLMTTGVEYGSAAKSKKTGKCPVIRMGNIQGGESRLGRFGLH